ncbi:MAG: flavin reductase [Cyclobacteriaceae bacterium]|nr:MAG: flavin reductase [Cyclobacteriaceae bacterium]
MDKVISLDPNEITSRQLHGYLLASVAPRPIAFVSTIDKAGNINLSPFSFFNVFSANPPVAIFSPARSARDNSTKHTYDNVNQVPEAVINLVNYSMIEQVSLASTAFPKSVNEFVKSGLTAVNSDTVSPPRVGESPVSFECKVNQIIPLGTEGGAGNLVICEVIRIHLKTEYLDASNTLQTERMDLVGRMGGNWYIRAFGDALFQISKPTDIIGRGVDQLPASVRNSTILTGSDLAKLGGLEGFPDESTLDKWKERPEIKCLLQKSHTPEEWHKLAKQMIDNQDIESGIKTLLVADELAF